MNVMFLLRGISFVLFLSLPAWAPADTVVLKNGDRLSGEGCSITGGKVAITTEAAGIVGLDIASVERITFSEPARVIPAEGEEETAGELSSEQLEKIDSVNPPRPKVWSLDLRAGYSLTRGNSDTQNADLRAEGVYFKEEDYRLTAVGEYAWGKVKDSETDEEDTVSDRGAASLQADLFLIEKGYLYGRSAWSYDRIKDLDWRWENGIGFGYEILRDESSFLDVEIGPSYIHSEYRDGTREHGVYLRLAEKGEIRLNDRVSAFEQVEYLPELKDFNNYLINAEAGLKVMLSSRLYLQLSVLDRYDNSPPEGNDRNDLSLISSLGVSL